MHLVADIVGVVMVVSVLADMVNTLVATHTGRARWWLTNVVYRLLWGLVRAAAVRIRSVRRRETLLSTFAPVSVLVLLMVWVAQQVVGFGLIWWGVGGVSGVGGIGDAIYFSGVVFFTVGFGELVPAEAIPRAGALVEALAGVLTTALVIGYLPSLYSAFSERERFLMLLDDGTEERITPTSLVLSRCHGGDPGNLAGFFGEWERWVAGVIETHTTFPMLVLFRSKDAGQHWVTALGLVADAALHIQIVRGAERGPQYWMLRRTIKLFELLTAGVDLSEYRARLDQTGNSELFAGLYTAMEEAGFDLVPLDEARVRAAEIRRMYGPHLEYLIDYLLAPRGFWGHAIGHRLGERASNEG